MKYTQNTAGGGEKSLDAGRRPPLELLPVALVELLRERDRIAVQRSDARARVVDLARPDLDAEAMAEDTTTATAAARAGKPIPETSARLKLATARDENGVGLSISAEARAGASAHRSRAKTTNRRAMAAP